jgi:hypothetical protein
MESVAPFALVQHKCKTKMDDKTNGGEENRPLSSPFVHLRQVLRCYLPYSLPDIQLSSQQQHYDRPYA